MNRAWSSLTDPCRLCFWRCTFPWSNSTSVTLHPQARRKLRCHSTQHSEPYVPLNSNVSLRDSVSQSRQACDKDAGDQSNDSATDKENETNDTKNKQNKRHLQKSDKSKKSRSDAWVQPEGYDTGIKIYNSLTREKEPLILPRERLATWYSCGPTVYDHAHIGHASAYVGADVIRRIMNKMFDIDVVFVMGITDIDDKIIKRAQELRIDYKVMARNFEKDFFRDIENLNVMPATVKTRVTEHIPHIINFISRIMDNEIAYRTQSGSVYFDVQAYGKYGKLWTHSLDSNIRDPLLAEKRNARDFALWKRAKPDEPYWQSPWGNGRPGWHIECSSMSSAVCGDRLDIHSGGEDLRFPHHENELAQSQACFACDQWTNYWLHTGQLHLKNDKSKMSKSLYNTISINKLLDSYTASQFRLFCMLRPYRSNVEYSDEAMMKSVQILRGWTSFLTSADAYVRGQLECKPINEPYLYESLCETRSKVEKALADDFDTPKAIVALENLVYKCNIEFSRKATTAAHHGVRNTSVIAAIASYIERITDVLGLQLSAKKVKSLYKPVARMATESTQMFDDIMDGVIEFRSKVRHFAIHADDHVYVGDISDMTPKEKRKTAMEQVSPLFKACDDLRDDLDLAGVKIKDRKSGATWEHSAKKIPEPSDERKPPPMRHDDIDDL